jgi:hypothetical protein
LEVDRPNPLSNDVDREVRCGQRKLCATANVSTTREEHGTTGRHQVREPFDVDTVKQREREQESEFEIVPKLEMTEEPGYGLNDRSLPLPFYTRDPTPICPFKDSQIGEELGQIHPIRRGLFEKPHERENKIEVKKNNIRYSGDDPRRRAVVGRSSNASRLRSIREADPNREGPLERTLEEPTTIGGVGCPRYKCL